MYLVHCFKRHALIGALVLPALLSACTTAPKNPTEDQMADAMVRKCRLTHNNQTQTASVCGDTYDTGKLPAGVMPPISAPQ